MRVIHFTSFAPGRSGMYESTKDQIKYERHEGLDSLLVDPLRPECAGRVDDWLEAVEWKAALGADIWVIHQALPPPLKEHTAKHLVIAVMHGPCEHMLLKEFAALPNNPDQPAFSVQHVNSIWNNDACVVIDKNAYEISKLYDEYDKLTYIPNSIDLERYDPEKISAWNFLNRPAIISCDVPRIEKIPVHILFSMPKVIERIPEARLSMFALPFHDIEFFRNLVCRSKKMTLDYDCCENFLMKTNTLAPFIKGGDIGFNSNYTGIMSRVHMEMMAMGVPVVSYNGDYTEYHAKIFDLDSIAEQIERCWNDLNDPKKNLKQKCIEYAHKHFDRGVHVKKYVELYQKLKEEKHG